MTRAPSSTGLLCPLCCFGQAASGTVVSFNLISDFLLWFRPNVFVILLWCLGLSFLLLLFFLIISLWFIYVQYVLPYIVHYPVLIIVRMVCHISLFLWIQFLCLFLCSVLCEFVFSCLQSSLWFDLYLFFLVCSLSLSSALSLVISLFSSVSLLSFCRNRPTSFLISSSGSFLFSTSASVYSHQFSLFFPGFFWYLLCHTHAASTSC